MSCGDEGCGPSVDSLRDEKNTVGQMPGIGSGSKAGSIDELISPCLTYRKPNLREVFRNERHKLVCLHQTEFLLSQFSRAARTAGSRI
jgi:hypothetical protein